MDIQPNNPLSVLQSMVMQSYANNEELRQKRNEQVEALRQSVRNRANTDEVERWAAMAEAAASVPPMVGNFGQLLAKIGGAYGRALAEQNARNISDQALILKAMGDPPAASFGPGAMTALVSDALNPRLTNVAGVGLVDQRTQRVVVPSNMMPEYDKVFSEYLKAAMERNIPNANQWAKAQADAHLSNLLNRPTIAGGRATTDSTSQPTSDSQNSAEVDIQPPEAINKWVKRLGEEERLAVANNDYDRALEIAKAKQALLSKMSQGNAPQKDTATRITPDLPQKNMREEEFKKEWGGAEAKTLEKALSEATSTLSKSTNLLSTLNTLEGLLNVDNMPEGKYAPLITEAQSALKSLGVDIKGPVGPAQVATALANEMALRLRTGSGENLMPGQMSNFDAQLLMNMAPNLSQTKEGRNALISLMREAAASQRRIAEKATDFAKEHNGMLTPEWRAEAARLENIEMAKRELARRKIMRQFNIK